MLNDKFYKNFDNICEAFWRAKPFNHVVIEDFLNEDYALELSKQFPDFNDPVMNQYNNPLEIKKTLNQWDRFPKETYRYMMFIGSDKFTSYMKILARDPDLHLDFGLNGGGWHMHGRGGDLNVHLDYSIHPKLGEQRKLNIILYMTPNWKEEWGGHLELWSHDEETNRPKERMVRLAPKFNTAVIFDTTQNSWHGLPDFVSCPEGEYRRSLAAYYVRPAPENVDQRGRALFAPREDQKNNPEIEELIRKRANVTTSAEVYRK